MSRRLYLLLLAWLVLGLRTPLMAAEAVPGFSISCLAKDERAYQSYTRIDGDHYAVEDDLVKATVTRLEPDVWQLKLSAKKPVQNICFPNDSSATVVGADVNDDVYYLPAILGRADRVTAMDQQTFSRTYPGQAFAPIMVQADAAEGRLIAALNWPAQRVIVVYGFRKIHLYYPVTLSPGAIGNYTALVASVKANPQRQILPWQAAVDLYRDWLYTHISTPRYPDWMLKTHGMVSVHLQNFWSWPTQWPQLKPILDDHIEKFPWVQFWGQMSTYGGSCCSLASHDFHPRYSDPIPNMPTLLEYVRDITGRGYHSGFYSAPNYSDPTALLDTPNGVSYLTDWLAINKNAGANAYYLDTVARTYSGVPPLVTGLMANGTIPENSVMEGAVDIYPRAAFVSGYFAATTWCGAPNKKITDENVLTTPFGRFGRYLLRDRMMFAGEGNGDGLFMSATSWKSAGTSCGYDAYCTRTGLCDYGTVREAFLLGFKYEGYEYLFRNEVIDEAIALRDRAQWWDRQPVYWDTTELDLSSFPSGSVVQVRRFADKAGAALFTVDNPRKEKGLSFVFRGQTFPISSDRLSLIDTAPPAAAPANVDPPIFQETKAGVFPNPWRADKHEGKPIRFDSLVGASEIRIFTIAGHLVKRLEGTTATVDWALDNTHGESVASGLYLYIIKDDQGRHRGKVMVVR